MVTGIGTDIVEISRVRQAIARREGFADRIFTEAEKQYCMSCANYAERLAGRFAAKEAVAKSLGVPLSWLDVEILPDEAGKPVVRLSGRAAELAGSRQVMVSISHCRTYAVAYAIAWLGGSSDGSIG